MKQCLIIVSIMLLITSCSAPTPSATVDLTKEPTPVVTSTPTPTATPVKGPISRQQAQKILESSIYCDVIYIDEINNRRDYRFEHNDISLIVNKSTGNVTAYPKFIIDTPILATSINSHQAIQLVINEVYRQNPTFFDYDIDYKAKHEEDESTYRVYLTQFSSCGLKTGNTAFAWVSMNGEIRNLILSDDEDPAIADKGYAITKEKAIEIAYENSINKIKNGILKHKSDAVIDLEDRTKHEIKVDFVVWKGVPTWHIAIKFPSNVGHIVGHISYINADTGEVYMNNRYS